VFKQQETPEQAAISSDMMPADGDQVYLKGKRNFGPFRRQPIRRYIGRRG